MFEKFITKQIINRVVDEKIYEEVAVEMAEGNVRPGLWVKATEHANGNKDKIESLYIKYRVQSLLDEAQVRSATKENIVLPKPKPKSDNDNDNDNDNDGDGDDEIHPILGFACITFVFVTIIVLASEYFT